MFKVGDFVYCPGGLDGSYYGRIIEIDNSHVACYKIHSIHYPQIIDSPGAILSFVRLPPQTGQTKTEGATTAPHFGQTHPVFPAVSIIFPLSTIQSNFSSI